MAVQTAQVPFGSLVINTAVQLPSIPAGPCTVIVSNTSNVVVFVGSYASAAAAQAATTGATGTGFAIPSNAPPVAIPGYGGSKGGQNLFVVASATAASGSVSVLISTDS